MWSDDDDDDDDDEKENSYSKFTSEISRYQMYSPNSDTVDELLYDMQTQAIFQIGAAKMLNCFFVQNIQKLNDFLY